MSKDDEATCLAQGRNSRGGWGNVSPPKFELGGTQYTLSPKKLINIMIKYHAPTKTEQRELLPLKNSVLKFSLNL